MIHESCLPEILTVNSATTFITMQYSNILEKREREKNKEMKESVYASDLFLIQGFLM